MSESQHSATDDVDFEMAITEGRTEIVVVGDRDTAVVVRSASGEQIYLPPEDFDRPPERRQRSYDSPYEGLGESPYEGPERGPYDGLGDGPYEGAAAGPYDGPGQSPYEGVDDGSDDGLVEGRSARAGIDLSNVDGLQPTADGYAIVHPEPVTDVRFLR